MRTDSQAFEAAVESTRSILRQVAARDENDARGYITYKELSTQLADLGYDVPYHAGAMPFLLAEVSRREHFEGRGMSSALVVEQDTRRPAAGFARFAAGEPFKRRGDDVSIWVVECQRLRRENTTRQS